MSANPAIARLAALCVTTALSGVLSASPAFGAAGAIAVVSPGDVVIDSAAAASTADDTPAILGRSLAGSVTITSLEAVTSGDRSAGIVGTTESPTGDVRIDSGTVATSGAASGGIVARAPGSIGDGPYGPTAIGNAVVTSGSVETLGADSIGIFAESLTAVAAVTSGSVSTAGDRAAGIVASGGAYAVVTSSSVETSGVEATGIAVTASLGPAVVDSGQVVTTGDGAAGIVAEAAGPVFIRSGSVETAGDPVATPVTPYYTYYGPPAAGIVGRSSQSGVTIESGTVATSGRSAAAILAEARGPIAITSGEVVTTGFGARGIDAYAQYGAVAIASESVAIHGDNAEGINAVTGSGRITITSGAVETRGTFSAGIRASGGGSITITSGTVTTANGGSAGIDAYTTGGDITLTSAAVTTASENSSGIRAAALASGGDIVVAAESVDTFGLTSDAINVYAGGSIDVTAGSLHTRGEQAAGVFATAYDAIRIEADSIVTEGPLSAGISALAYGGSVDIAVDEVTTRGDSSVGVYGGGLGDVTISAGSVVTSGDRLVRIDSYTGQAIYYESPTGIAAYSYGGDVVVTADSVASSGYGSQGISTYSVFATTSVTVGTVTATGAQSAGIRARGGLGATVIADVVETSGAGIDAGGAVGETLIRANRIVTTGDRAEAASVVSMFGAATIETGQTATQGDYSSAVRVLVGGAPGYSDDGAVISGEASTAGDHSRGIWSEVYIGSAFVESGRVTTSGYDSAGILVSAGTDVVIDSGSVTTSGKASDAINALSQISPFGGDPGAVSIASDTVVTSGDSARGIVGIGPGDVTIASGSVETRGETALLSRYELVVDENGYYSYELVQRPGPRSVGILAESSGGAVTITSGSVRTRGREAHGIVAATDAGAIAITSGDIAVSGRDSNAIHAVSQSGTIAVAIEGEVHAARGTGVDLSTGGRAEVRVANGGRLIGATGRAALDARSAATTVTIAQGGLVRGAVTLGEGDDELVNDGLFDARGTSAFGAGDDLIDNEGTLRAAAGETRFDGLERLANRGLVTLRDGQADDHLDLSSTRFDGGAGSRLELDVVAGAQGALAADRLTVGDVGGTTLVSLAARGIATLDSEALLVRGLGPLAAQAFVLDPASADAGLLRYRLVARGNDRLLVTAPDDEIFALAGIAGAAAGGWQRSADAWSQQLALRRAAPDATTRRTWIEASTGERTLSDRRYRASWGAERLERTLDSEERFDGVQLGGDLALGGGFVGLTAGLGGSRLGTGIAYDPVRTKSHNLGLYGGWSNGRGFVAALAKLDRTRLDLGALAGVDDGTIGASSVGLQVEGGWRLGSARLHAEPMAALTWTSTRLDGLASAQGDLDFDSGRRVRAMAGLRVGGEARLGPAWRVIPTLGAWAISGDRAGPGLSFRSGSQTLAVRGERGSAHARFEGGVRLAHREGLSASLSGEADVGSHVSGWAARAGLAWRW